MIERLALLVLRYSDQSLARPKSSHWYLVFLSTLIASTISLVYQGTEKPEDLAQGTARLTSLWVKSTR